MGQNENIVFEPSWNSLIRLSYDINTALLESYFIDKFNCFCSFELNQNVLLFIFLPRMLNILLQAYFYWLPEQC